MDVISTDVAITGTGGAGFRAAIAVAEVDPSLNLCLLSKVFPCRATSDQKCQSLTSLRSIPALFAGQIVGFTWSPAPLPSLIVSLSLLPFTWSLAHRPTPN
jgi:hypothetical protein